MEPLNDRELDELLRQWPARPAPDSLTRRIRHAQRGPWWQWLLTGSIRIPVPLALGAALVLALAFFALRGPRNASTPQPQSAVFHPVKRLEPRIIRSSYETDN